MTETMARAYEMLDPIHWLVQTQRCRIATKDPQQRRFLRSRALSKRLRLLDESLPLVHKITGGSPALQQFDPAVHNLFSWRADA